MASPPSEGNASLLSRPGSGNASVLSRSCSAAARDQQEWENLHVTSFSSQLSEGQTKRVEVKVTKNEGCGGCTDQRSESHSHGSLSQSRVFFTPERATSGSHRRTDAEHSMWQDANNEHERALLALESEVEKIAESFAADLQQTEDIFKESLQSFTRRLKSHEEREKKDKKERDKEKAELILFQSERAMLMQELNELRCMSSKSRVQHKLGEQGLEKVTARATKAEAKAKEVEDVLVLYRSTAQEALVQKRQKWAKKNKDLQINLDEATKTIKSLQALILELESQAQEAASKLQISQHQQAKVQEESKRSQREHTRALDSQRRESDATLALSRDQFDLDIDQLSQTASATSQHFKTASKEKEAAKNAQIEQLTLKLEEADEALQSSESNSERIAKSAASRNAHFNSLIKTKDLEISEVKHEMKKLEDFLTKSQDLQKTLEVQLVQQREHKHSEAYQHQRQALSEALHQLSVQSEEVHSLRSQVTDLKADMLAESTLKEQALSSHCIQRHALILECEQRRQGEARLNAAEVEASSRRLEHLQTQVKELQHELNQAHHRQAHTELKLAEENDVLKQRLAALGTAGSLLMQVSPAKDVNRMEDEIDKLRTDNFNLKIRIGDLENSGGINDFHRHLAPQGLINSDGVTPGANGGSAKARVGGADTSHDTSQSNMHTDQDTVVYGDASEVGLSSSWWKSFSASSGASNSSAPMPFVKKQASSDSPTLISTDDAIEFSRLDGVQLQQWNSPTWLGGSGSLHQLHGNVEHAVSLPPSLSASEYSASSSPCPSSRSEGDRIHWLQAADGLQQADSIAQVAIQSPLCVHTSAGLP